MISNGDPSAIHWSHSDEYGNVSQDTPASGDKVLLEKAADGAKYWADVDDLPGGGGGGSANASYSEKVGDASTTTFEVEHSLDSSAVVVEVIEVSSGDALVAGTDYTWSVVSDDKIEVVFDSAPDADDALVVVVASGGTSSSGGGSGWSPILDTKPGTADTPDCEFDGSLGNWTAVTGSPGTVNPLLDGSTVTQVYDLATRDGWLLVQCGTADLVEFVCDHELPDGASIVAAISAPLNAQSGDNQMIGLSVSNNASHEGSGTFVRIMLEQDNSEWVVQGNSSSSASGIEMTTRNVFAERVYLRIIRSGLTYSTWFSYDGMTWNFVYQLTVGAALDKIWLAFVGASVATYAPIFAVDWVRQGSDDLDPW